MANAEIFMQDDKQKRFYITTETKKVNKSSKSFLMTLLAVTKIVKVDIHVFSRSEEHTSELQSRFDLVCRLLLEKKKKKKIIHPTAGCRKSTSTRATTSHA